VAKGGYVLTNRHVIEGGGKTLMIVTAGGERFPAELVATGGGTDLALLKAAISREHAFLLLANSDAIRTGEQVYAIGSPEGLPQVAAEESSATSNATSGAIVVFKRRCPFTRTTAAGRCWIIAGKWSGFAQPGWERRAGSGRARSGLTLRSRRTRRGR
jgi:S1-C subfamily serine protease